jgi:hypothetical protein
MKKFIFSILCVSVFFIGLGGLINQVGAKFKSDERALAIIAQARQAIGGDAAIKSVKSLTVVGNSTNSFVVDGAAKTEQGNVEINLQLPNQFSKTLKIGRDTTGAEGGTVIEKDVKVFVRSIEGDSTDSAQNDSDGTKKRIVRIRKNDGQDAEILKKEATAEGNKIFINRDVRVAGAGNHQQNELFRTTFALLLSAPEGLDVSYTYIGEGNVDNSSCDIVQAQVAGDSAVKLYIDKTSHLPLMLTYQGMKPMVFRYEKDAARSDAGKDVRVMVRKGDAPAPEMQEFQLKFSDYRSVGGVQLPYKWTQTAGGQVDQTIDVVNYEVNPANIADKFTRMPRQVFVRSEKKQ